MNDFKKASLVVQVVNRLSSSQREFAIELLKKHDVALGKGDVITSEALYQHLRGLQSENLDALNRSFLDEMSSNPSRVFDWNDGLYKLFISHRSVDKALAEELKELLGLLGVACFVSGQDIVASELWRNTILRALDGCDGLLALLTESFHESKWTDQEVGYAIGKGKQIFPLEKGLAPYGLLESFQLVNKEEDGVKGLAVSLFFAIATRNSLINFTETIVQSIESSLNYLTSSTCVAALEKIQPVEFAIKTRVLSASETNGQVGGVMGIKSRINRITTK
ncbi:MAG: toll/interleukin-1 receptor domain-containing protein [Bdellovibrio sp.]|nr:toll/interleukin-1 receptor domain-containing protein [Bdellovibrio sp.]